MKEDKPGWQKAESVERVYVKYYPKNNLLTHEATIPNQREYLHDLEGYYLVHT